MSEWREITLGDFVSLQRGHDLTENERKPGHIPVMGSAGMNGCHNTALAKGPGVVVGRSGASFGQVHYCRSDYWPHNTALYVTDFRGNDTRFTYYFLKSLDFTRYNSGSAQASLNRNYIYPIPIRVPEPTEQRAIASVLGALDDKIELNRRMNETLEALAQSLFKSWFLDATRDGIPRGWREVSVGDEAELVKGVSYRSVELADSETALVTLKSFKRGGGYRSDGLKPYTGEFDREQIVEPGELVVANTDVTQAAEVIGKPALVLPDGRFKTLVASLDLTIVRPKASDLSRHFFYLLFRTDDFQSHIYGHTNGTTVLHLSKTGIPTYRFARPPESVAREFSRIVASLYQRIEANEAESRTFAAFRNALLPKLLSGEVRVPDAKQELACHA